MTLADLSLADRLRAEVGRDLDDAVQLRHALHAAPCLGGGEDPAAQLVTDWIGLGPGQVVAGTGRLLRVTPGPGAAVALRAELDALPIDEATGVPWASDNGAMHACGHDVHLAALACVARAAARVELPVPLVALLQPREEGANSGARDVVDEGGLTGLNAVVAAHLQPRLPPGVIAATPGPVNASFDDFTVVVRGQGGHSGYPHTVDDSVLALSAVVVALQQVGARRIDPTFGVACMVNQLAAGTATNVVPASATGSGSLRTMRSQDRTVAQQAMTEIVTHVAAAHGCTGEITFVNGEPVLVNDADLAGRAGEVLAGLGHPVVRDFRSFGADDFSHYCEATRGLMLFVGTGGERGGLHDATYLPDDSYVATVADALVAGYCAAAGATS